MKNLLDEEESVDEKRKNELAVRLLWSESATVSDGRRCNEATTLSYPHPLSLRGVKLNAGASVAEDLKVTEGEAEDWSNSNDKNEAEHQININSEIEDLINCESEADDQWWCSCRSFKWFCLWLVFGVIFQRGGRRCEKYDKQRSAFPDLEQSRFLFTKTDYKSEFGRLRRTFLCVHKFSGVRPVTGGGGGSQRRVQCRRW